MQANVAVPGFVCQIYFAFSSAVDSAHGGSTKTNTTTRGRRRRRTFPSINKNSRRSPCGRRTADRSERERDRGGVYKRLLLLGGEWGST